MTDDRELDKNFRLLNSIGTQLYAKSQRNDPISLEHLAEIDVLICICRESARTKKQQSIVFEVQTFWDLCFRKWHSTPEELEKEQPVSNQEVTALQPRQPSELEKIGMFAALVRAIRTLKSGRGLANLTPDDFPKIRKLIEQCGAISVTKYEKKVIQDALDTYDTQFHRWQELQQQKKSKLNDFESDLSENDLKFLRSLRIRGRKEGEDELE